jgi:hypothetical protein
LCSPTGPIIVQQGSSNMKANNLCKAFWHNDRLTPLHTCLYYFSCGQKWILLADIPC